MVVTEVQWQEAAVISTHSKCSSRETVAGASPWLPHAPSLNKLWSESQYGIWREVCLGLSVGSAGS